MEMANAQQNNHPEYMQGINEQTRASQPIKEYFTNIVYLEDNHNLCAATNLGKLYSWKRCNHHQASQAEEMWQLMNIFQIDSNAIKQCCWGLNSVAKPCLLLISVANVYILKVSISPN